MLCPFENYFSPKIYVGLEILQQRQMKREKCIVGRPEYLLWYLGTLYVNRYLVSRKLLYYATELFMIIYDTNVNKYLVSIKHKTRM